jgi:4-alpha-glucanotransferase
VRGCKLTKFNLVLLIHGHQPVGNFDAVVEHTYQRSYLPFVECLLRHPGVRLGLHYSGPLLEWCEQRHPEFFRHLQELASRGQIELVGGGFYEPILVSIPPEDQAKQIQLMRDYLRQKFGREPEGAWLAERVWEPQVPSALAPAGVRYTLVDDVHFLAAGFELEQLYADYVSEDQGRTVRVFPGLKSLRYLLPFRPCEEAIGFLRESAQRHPGGMAAMGDDCEKFGGWPGTYDHCYRDSWLDRFFAALEESHEWLAVTPPGEYIREHQPRGRADLPAASYSEMMEWTLPTKARTAFHIINQEFANRPDVQRFLRGGPWRAFFTKYPESNLLHKKMLRVSAKCRNLTSKRISDERSAKNELAQKHLLRAQCNDAYWHGVFGGIYAPHLRTELWRELIRAESLLDEGTRTRADGVHIEQTDFDGDGRDELYVTSKSLAALLRPADGGTLACLDFRPSAVTLINSMQRRPEAYHRRLREASSGGNGQIASIHDQVRSKEEGLERFLRYDRWPRNAFRLLLFPADKTFKDYEELRLEENPVLAAGAYGLLENGPTSISLECELPCPDCAGNAGTLELMRCTKRFSFAAGAKGYHLHCTSRLSSANAQARPALIGVEIVLNFLAPHELNRYFEISAGRHPLAWSAALSAAEVGPRLKVVDEWQNVAATIEAPSAKELWITPIETISESEEGFERVYQGSQILAVWPIELGAGKPWTGEISLRVESALAAKSHSHREWVEHSRE